MKLVKSFDVDAPPEQVGQVLCSEAFNVAAERDRDEVLDARHVLLEERGGDLVFEVRSTEYKRKKTGGIDRSGTVESKIRNTYDARARTLSWVYEGAGSRWVSVTGIYRLTPTERGTHVIHDISIEVNIPLIGGRIAKMISGEFDAATRRFERLLRDQLRSSMT